MSRILLLVPTATYRAGAFVRAARKLPYKITIASEEPSSLSDLVPDDLIGMSFSDTQGCLAEARSLAERQNIVAVVPVDDQVTVLAAEINTSLGLPGNDADAVRATRNKHLLRQRLDSAHVPQPRSILVGVGDHPLTAVDDIGYPCVVKPLAMSASRGVTRANTPAELERAVAALQAILESETDVRARDSYLIEQYVPGWEVSIEGIVTDGRLHTCAIFDKPDPLEGPQFAESIYVTPSSLSAAEQAGVIDLTQRGLNALDIAHGPIHAEVRGQNGEMWFIETAARSIGGYCSKVLVFEGDRSLEEIILQHAVTPDAPLPARESQASGVLMMQAPAKGRFVEMRGVDTVRGQDGIEEVIVSAHRGQTVTPLPEGFLYVGFVFAKSATPAAVEAILRLARDTLTPIIEPD